MLKLSMLKTVVLLKTFLVFLMNRKFKSINFFIKIFCNKYLKNGGMYCLAVHSIIFSRCGKKRVECKVYEKYLFVYGVFWHKNNMSVSIKIIARWVWNNLSEIFACWKINRTSRCVNHVYTLPLKLSSVIQSWSNFFASVASIVSRGGRKKFDPSMHCDSLSNDSGSLLS